MQRNRLSGNLIKHLFGIDLSGPSNTADTVIVHAVRDKNRLAFVQYQSDLDDTELVEWIYKEAGENPGTIAVDAPLSYQPGGGLRESDRQLRRFVKEQNIYAGIMPPTLTRMVYITLRGMNIARIVQSTRPEMTVLENHPGTTLQLHGMPRKLVQSMKKDPEARANMVEFLRAEIDDLPVNLAQTDHALAACGCILAADDYIRGKCAWTYDHQTLQHPYRFVC